MNTDISSSDSGYGIVMQENRLQGERIIARIRIVVALCAAPGFIACKLMSGTFVGLALEYLYLSALGLTVLYSLMVLYYLRLHGYRRFIPFLSSVVDVTAVSVTILVILAYEVDPYRALIYLTLAYSAYHLAILLSLRRYDPGNGLFTGALAAVQYLLIMFLFRYTGVLPAESASGVSLWIETIAGGELFKGLILSLSGLLSFALARNLTRSLLSAIRTEGSRRVEQAYLGQFFDSTPEAIVLSDNTTRIMRINSAFTRLFGYSDKESLGRRIDDLVAPRRFRAEAVDLSEKAREGAEFLIETVRERKDHSLVDVSILGAPIFFEGQQVAIFGIYRDETERKRKERLLQALNQAASVMQGALSLEQIIDAVAEVLRGLGYNWDVMLLDETGQTLRVKYVSFVSDLVRTVEHLLGSRVLEIEVPVGCAEDIAAVIHKGETRFVEDSTELVRALVPGSAKGLAERFVAILGVTRSIGAPLMQEGKTIGILGVHSPVLRADDIPAITAFANQLSAAWQKVSLIGKLEKNITELQHTQAQLVQAQKMEAVGRLAGGIAHDFNNLLTVIRGYSELLLNEAQLDSSVLETVEEIRRAGEQASQLTGHLLAFSRKQVTRPRNININDTVQGMEKILQRLIGEDIELETELEENLAPIRIDPHQIEQVIMNLAVNARDAMPQGGSLCIETANADLNSAFTAAHPEVPEGRYVLLAIIDTGSGIEQSILPQIFDPFFTTKERGRGTGLGLSTVYGIVKQSMGYVYADNEPGGGARFALYFPPGDGDAVPETRQEKSQPIPEGSGKILLVEDEETVRQLTRTILERSGYRVICASNAEQALSLDAEELADIRLLVTDVVMPGMNGRILAKELLERFPGLKVLFLSGYAAELTAGEISAEQESEFLQKPFSRVDLLKKLQQMMGG